MKTKSLVLSIASATLLQMPFSIAGQVLPKQQLSQAQHSKLELIPVKFSDRKSDPNCIQFGDKWLLPLSSKRLVVEDFLYSSKIGELGVELMLSDRQQKQLANLTRKYLGQNLAFIHNGKVLMVPRVKSLIDGEKLNLTFKNIEDFEAVLNKI